MISVVLATVHKQPIAVFQNLEIAQDWVAACPTPMQADIVLKTWFVRDKSVNDLTGGVKIDE